MKKVKIGRPKQSEEEIKRSLLQPSMHKAPSKRPNEWTCTIVISA